MKKNVCVKVLIAALLCVCILLSFCSCGEKKSINNSFYTFYDSGNQKIVLNKKPEKVAVLFSSFADMWLLAGGKIYATVGESVERGIAQKDVLLCDGGAGKTIDTELLISCEPDFVIGSLDVAAQADAAKVLSDAKIPTALFKVESFDDYLEVLKIMTDITENPQALKMYGYDKKEVIEKIRAEGTALAEKEDKKDILFIRAGSKYSATKAKTKKENFVCKMLDELGTYNIAENAPVLLDGLSVEEILLNEPEYIFISTMGDEQAAKSYIEDLFSTTVWQSLEAVREGKYAFLEKELFQYKPNAKWDLAYEKLFELVWN